MASIYEQEAEEELREKNKNKVRKHTEYRINKSMLVGKLRNDLIEIILNEDDKEKEQLYHRLMEELQRNVVPVIPNRNFKREKQSKANRFTQTKRRNL